jgi:hypothetical protein
MAYISQGSAQLSAPVIVTLSILIVIPSVGPYWLSDTAIPNVPNAQYVEEANQYLREHGQLNPRRQDQNIGDPTLRFQRQSLQQSQ